MKTSYGPGIMHHLQYKSVYQITKQQRGFFYAVYQGHLINQLSTLKFKKIQICPQLKQNQKMDAQTELHPGFGYDINSCIYLFINK